MLLSARMLDGVADVNTFTPVGAARFTEGDTPIDIYFQLVDASKDTEAQGFRPTGRRYVPASGATLSAKLEHVDDAKKITRSCTQPFDDDPSIWKLTVVTADALRGTVTMRLILTEGARVVKGNVRAAILVDVVG